jgi:hypothetical protein
VTLEPRAVLLGAAVALAIAVPFGLIAGLVLDAGSSGAAVLPFFVVALAALLAGGFVAASKGPDAPLSSAAVAALAAYMTGQAITTVVNLVRGNDVHPVAIVFDAVLATSVGIVGGLLASRRNDALQQNSVQ